MFCDKVDVEVNPSQKQHIVSNRKAADDDRYHHKQKPIENQVPLQIGRYAENPLRPGPQLSEEIDVHEIVERKAVLNNHRWFSIEVEEHQRRDENNHNDLCKYQARPWHTEERDKRVPFTAEIRYIEVGYVEVKKP